MNRVVVSSDTRDWHIALARALSNADAQTVIVVDTEAKKELALRSAGRAGKVVNVEVGTSPRTASSLHT